MPGAEDVLRNLGRLEETIRRNAEMAAAEIALTLEAYAKTHHLWQRDTGATDASTRGTWEWVDRETLRIVLSAGMDYDVYLELARQGRYAWLLPAVEANQDAIREILRRRMQLR